MGSIIGIPTTRVSDLFIRQRLMNQIQGDQLELFQIQTQLSTGHVIQAPSEDADAALRIMSLQRLLERKDQVQTNLATNQSYLLASDSTLMSIYSTVAEVKAIALGAVGAKAGDTQRLTAIQQIQETLRQLVDAGNQKFRGRYIFTGAGTMIRPFELTDDYSVKYNGDEKRLASYSDIDLLFDTNVHGSEVFGALSDPVRGATDLNPALTYDTRLADLHNGAGIASGSIVIGVATAGLRQTSIIDLSDAETVGDVAAMIRANPPTGKTLDVEVTPTGLRIEVQSAPPDTLTIQEVAGGTTANDLGIHTRTGTTAPVAGDDLDPIVRLTTRVEDLLGTRSQAVVRFGGGNNDLIIRAKDNGTVLSGTQVTFNGVPGGPVGFVHDPAAKTLTVTYDSFLGTTAQEVVDALAADVPGAGDDFTAMLDPTDGGSNDGSGVVSTTPAPLTMSGGSGTTLDKDSGLQIVNGASTYSISFANADTIEDVLNTLNMSKAGVLAEINEDATGIDIRSRLSGKDFMIGENGGTTATQLGLRSFTEDTRLDDLNFGRGVAAGPGTDFSITLADGSTIDVDLTRSDGTGLVGQTDPQNVPTMAGGSASTAASMEMTFDGSNNDLIISTVAPGTTYNGTEVVFEQGSGTAFNYTGNRLTIQFDPGVTTAQDIVDDITAWGGAFTAVVEPTDGAVPETVGDLLNLINTDDQNVDPATGRPLLQARLATFGNGIELADLTTGTGSITVTRQPTSEAAMRLGLVPEGELTSTGGAASDAATASIVSLGANNDLVITAVAPGLAGNNIDVVFRPVPAGAPSLSLTGNVLTVQYDPTVTTANDLVAAAAGDPNFTVALAANDNDGSGSVAAGTATMSAGTVNTPASATLTFTGSNNNLTLSAQSSGVTLNDTMITFVDNPGNPITFTHNAGAKTLQIEFDSTVPTTAADVVAALRADPLGVPGGLFSATLDATDGLASDGNGLINPAGFPATAGGNATTPATVTVRFPGTDNDLAFTTKPPGGPGVNGLQIVFREMQPPGGPVTSTFIPGQMLIIDVDPNVTTAQQLVAAMALDPNFLVTSNEAPNTGLGVVSTTPLDTASGGAQAFTGTDVNPLETESVFAGLLRIMQALQSDDAWQMERAVGLLEQTTLDMNFSRAELGARQQGLDIMEFRLDSEEIDLRAALSENFDVDMVEAISNFTGRQIALQAALQTAATIMRLTLMDYL